MATRSLTEVFILMRNNALQNRHIFSEQVSKLKRDSSTHEKLLVQGSTPTTPMNDDRMALVSRDTDLEMGIASGSRSNRLPPEWVDGVEEVQYELSKIKDRMRELSSLHDKHLNRPTLDDSMDEEHAIEIQTREVTQIFHRCQKLVQQINTKSRVGSPMEQKLTNNITASIARSIQEFSTTFRKMQSIYLKKLQTREERSKQYFDTDLIGGDSYQGEEADELYDRGFTQQQLLSVEDSSQFVQTREREVTLIVRSIQDLNEIFKDLATMIVDQGTLLDRIDYNIEQTATRVDSGLKQLQKAEKYQKKNRKMMVIVIMFVIVIILVIILLAVKS